MIGDKGMRVNTFINYVKKRTLPKIIILITFNIFSPYKIVTFDPCYGIGDRGTAIINLGLLSAAPICVGPKERTKALLENFGASLKEYKRLCNVYPKINLGLKALVEKPKGLICDNYPEEGFLEDKVIPKDFWGKSVVYCLINDMPLVISAGPDRVFGTVDDLTSEFGAKKGKLYQECIESLAESL